MKRLVLIRRCLRNRRRFIIGVRKRSRFDQLINGVASTVLNRQLLSLDYLDLTWTGFEDNRLFKVKEQNRQKESKLYTENFSNAGIATIVTILLHLDRRACVTRFLIFSRACRI